MSQCKRITDVSPPAAVVTHAAALLQSHTALTAGRTFLFAASVGVIVMNLFAAQTLTGPISTALGLAPRLAGLIAMLPQLGYAAGLVLLVPLVDVHENRRLIVCQLVCCALFLALAMFAPSGLLYLVSVFLAGAAASAIQMLVPMAALMAPEMLRGRAVGNVMSGLMVGVLLSRPLASFLADLAGWRAVYGVLAGGVMLIAIALGNALPRRRPAVTGHYRELLVSLWHLLRDEPVLRRRAALAALGMGAFSAFWTSVGMLLARAPYALTQRDIALFAFAGAAGAVVAPLAGRAGDRGDTRTWSIGGHLAAVAATALAAVAGIGLHDRPHLGIALLAVSAILLDAGVTADQTVGRRAINLLDPAARGRLNGLFVGVFFVGGALGSACSGWAWAHGGWACVCAVQLAFSLSAVALAARTRG